MTGLEGFCELGPELVLMGAYVLTGQPLDLELVDIPTSREDEQLQ